MNVQNNTTPPETIVREALHPGFANDEEAEALNALGVLVAERDALRAELTEWRTFRSNQEHVDRLEEALQERDVLLRGAQFVVGANFDLIRKRPEYDPTGEGQEVMGEMLRDIEAAIGPYETGAFLKARAAFKAVRVGPASLTDVVEG